MEDALERAMISLEGLSVGDAFGQRFFMPNTIANALIESRQMPPPPWPYTDDTEMALSLVSTLRDYDSVDPDELAQSFALRYDPRREYGPAMHRLLPWIAAGGDWEEGAQSLFSGQGSFGNGAAMRVAPLGAYFAEDLDECAEQAARSSIVTHTHSEASAGAIAVAIAAAWAWRLREKHPRPSGSDFLDLVLPYVPEGLVRQTLREARDLPRDTPILAAASYLGNGSQVSAQDTVPFVLWCAARHLDSYEEALWTTIQGMGDQDTNCAMVGGMVVLSAGLESIPSTWLAAREPLPEWAGNGDM